MTQVNTNLIQYFAIVGSVSLLIFIFYLVRNKKIKEQYSILWIILSFVFILFSIWREGLNYLAAMIGIAYPPIAFILILVMSIFLILIQYSIIISQLKETNKNLIQEIALLKLLVQKNIFNKQ